MMKAVTWILSFSFMLITACGKQAPASFLEADSAVSLQPDYTDITVPVNIAPLNFRILMPGKQFMVRFTGENGYTFDLHASRPVIRIPLEKWRRLLAENAGSAYALELFVAGEDGQWTKYRKITNRISADKIDPYLVYRLIEPGYAFWNEMGIYQRNLEDFEEQPVMINRMSDKNCMNCHAFSSHDPETMMLHMRGQHAGTYIRKNNRMERVQTKSGDMLSAGVYPSWSPDGTKIAFSTNQTIQFFHALPNKRIEVLDLASDIILYDVDAHTVTAPAILNQKEQFETFPHWAPDGKYLYYCSAEAHGVAQYDSIRYSLLRIAYDQASASFGAVDTLVSAQQWRKSVSFPRVSPDNRWLLFTLSDYGNFSIWHPEADLYLYDLMDGTIAKVAANSQRAESYHTWSSDSRWIVFSSRRDDSQYSRPYFAAVDANGETTKPFILPQEDPDCYDFSLKSYNVPELIKSRIPLDPYDFRPVMDQEAVQATLK